MDSVRYQTIVIPSARYLNTNSFFSSLDFNLTFELLRYNACSPMLESIRLTHRSASRYAATYSCPHVFCFDGATLLFLRFRCDSAEELALTATVEYHICSALSETSLVRLKYYCFISNGVRSVLGETGPDEPMELTDEIERKFRFDTGERYYENNETGGESSHPPNGSHLHYDNDDHEWYWDFDWDDVPATDLTIPR